MNMIARIFACAVMSSAAFLSAFGNEYEFKGENDITYYYYDESWNRGHACISDVEFGPAFNGKWEVPEKIDNFPIDYWDVPWGEEYWDDNAWQWKPELPFGAEKVTKITLPPDMGRLNHYLQCFTNLTAVTVKSGGTFYRSDNGVLYKVHKHSSRESLELVHYPLAKRNSSYTFPENVEEFDVYCRYDSSGNPYLKTICIELPKSREDIRVDISSSYFPNLKTANITIHGENDCLLSDYHDDDLYLGNVDTVYLNGDGCVPEALLSYNWKIEKVVVGKGIVALGQDCFEGCESLEEVSLPAGLLRIGSWAFSGCESLKQLDIPSSVTEIGDFAFYNCPARDTRADDFAAALDLRNAKVVKCDPGCWAVDDSGFGLVNETGWDDGYSVQTFTIEALKTGTLTFQWKVDSCWEYTSEITVKRGKGNVLTEVLTIDGDEPWRTVSIEVKKGDKISWTYNGDDCGHNARVALVSVGEPSIEADIIERVRSAVEDELLEKSSWTAILTRLDAEIAKAPADYKLRVYRAASHLLNALYDTRLKSLFETTGYTVSGLLDSIDFSEIHASGKLSFANLATSDVAVDTLANVFLPAIAAARADLDVVTKNWSGSFVLDPSDIPSLSERLLVDNGDILLLKAILAAAASSIEYLQSQSLNVNYAKLPILSDGRRSYNFENTGLSFAPGELDYTAASLLRAETIHDVASAPVVNGIDNDWSNVPEANSDDYVSCRNNGNWHSSSPECVRDVRVARKNDTLFISFRTSHWRPSEYVRISLCGYDIDYNECATFCWNDVKKINGAYVWSDDSVQFAMYGDFVELSFKNRRVYSLQSDEELSIYLRSMDNDPDEYEDYWWYDYYNDSLEFEVSSHSPEVCVKSLLQDHPSALSARNSSKLKSSGENLRAAIAFMRQADEYIVNRSDAHLHFFEYAPEDEELIEESRTRLKQVDSSLSGPIVLDADIPYGIGSRNVYLGAIFSGSGITRSLLPPVSDENTVNLSALPDPTFNGLFPGLQTSDWIDWVVMGGLVSRLDNAEKLTHVVTFDLGENGERVGGGALVQYVVTGGDATPPIVSPKAGWTFEGWSDSYTSISRPVTLTAVYARLHDVGDLICGDSIETTNGIFRCSDDNIPEYEGWYFVGWNSRPDGSGEWADLKYHTERGGSIATVYGMLYDHWFYRDSSNSEADWVDSVDCYYQFSSGAAAAYPIYSNAQMEWCVVPGGLEITYVYGIDDDYCCYYDELDLGTIAGRPIVGIGESAFDECLGLYRISLPDTLQYIRPGAFCETGFFQERYDELWGNNLEGVIKVDGWVLYATPNFADEGAINIANGIRGMADDWFYDLDWSYIEEISVPGSASAAGAVLPREIYNDGETFVGWCTSHDGQGGTWYRPYDKAFACAEAIRVSVGLDGSVFYPQFIEGEVNYEIVDDGIRLYWTDNSDLPATISGLRVRSAAYGAFDNLTQREVSLGKSSYSISSVGQWGVKVFGEGKSIEIPNGVCGLVDGWWETIDGYNLESISFPTSMAGADIALPNDNVIYYDCYNFIGWNTSPDGSGEWVPCSYDVNSDREGFFVRIPEGGAKYYAVFIDDSLEFRDYGVAKVLFDQETILPASLAGRRIAIPNYMDNTPYSWGEDKHMVGWCTSKDGKGTWILPDSEYSDDSFFDVPAGGARLYAMLIPNYYECYYDQSGIVLNFVDLFDDSAAELVYFWQIPSKICGLPVVRLENVSEWQLSDNGMFANLEVPKSVRSIYWGGGSRYTEIFDNWVVDPGVNSLDIVVPSGRRGLVENWYQFVKPIIDNLTSVTLPATAAGTQVTLPDDNFTSDGIFIGWNTQSDGSGEWAPYDSSCYEFRATVPMNGATWYPVFVDSRFEIVSSECGEWSVLESVDDEDAESLSIPSSWGCLPLAEIAEFAFENCTNLLSVSIPDSVRKIGSNAFFGTALLQSQQDEADSGLVYADGWVVASWGSITNVVIQKGTRGLADCWFDDLDHTSLRSIKLPSSLAGRTVMLPDAYWMVDQYAGFFGWNTSQSGDGEWFYEEATIPNGGVTLYAVFSQKRVSIAGIEWQLVGKTAHIHSMPVSGKTVRIPERIDGYPVVSLDFCAFDFGCEDAIPFDLIIPSSVTSCELYNEYINSITFEGSRSSEFVAMIKGPYTESGSYIDGWYRYAGDNEVGTAKSFAWCYSCDEFSEVSMHLKNGEFEYAHCLACGQNDSVELDEVFYELPVPATGACYRRYVAPCCGFYREDGELHVCYIDNPEGWMRIPDSYEGEPVVGIGAYCCEAADYLRGVVVPSSVQWIGDRAFADCLNLTQVKLPDSLAWIGSDVFLNVPIKYPNFVFEPDLAGGKESDGYVAFFDDGKIVSGTAERLEFTYFGIGIDVVWLYSEPEILSWNVWFDLGEHGDWIGGGALEQVIDDGCAAIAPEVCARSDWRFIGWDVPFACVTEELTVKAVYEYNPPIIITPPDDPVVPPQISENEIPVSEVTQLISDDDPLTPESATQAKTYNAFILDGNGLAGTLQVSTSKADKKGVVKVNATLVRRGVKTKLSGVLGADGLVVLADKKGTSIEVRIGENGISSVDDDITLSGSRNAFADKSSTVDLSKWKGNWSVVFSVEPLGFAQLSVAVGAKGATKVTGSLPDGSKISASTTLVTDDNGRAFVALDAPLYSKKGGFSALFALGDDGSVKVVGDPVWNTTGAKVSFDGVIELVDGAPTASSVLTSGMYSVFVDESAFDDDIVIDALPYGELLSITGTKFVCPKAGKVALDKKTGEIVISGDNPSGLKLTYTAKTGAIKGSFSLYRIEKGAPKKYAMDIVGSVVGDRFYATASNKKLGLTVRLDVE